MISRYVTKIGRLFSERHSTFYDSQTFRSIRLENDDPSVELMEILAESEGHSVNAEELGNEKLFGFLSELGFLKDEQHSNACNIPKIFDKFIGINRHIAIHFLLTQYCNLGCVYCYNGTDSYQLKNKLKLDELGAMSALKLFYRYAHPHGSVSINLLGGEPLLNWSTAHTILKNYRKVSAEAGFKGETKFSVQTNLTFLPPHFIDDAKNHLIDIVVEVDGDKEIQDKLRPHKTSGVSSYDLTEKNCSKLTANGIAFRCKSVITSENIEMIDEIERIHKKLGANFSSFGMVRPVDSDFLAFEKSLLPTPAQMEKAIAVSESNNGTLYRHTKEEAVSRITGYKECGTVGCYHKHAAIFTVTSDGKIYNCPWFVGNDENFLGSVSDANLDKQKIIEAVEGIGQNLDATCAGCEFFNGCGGGCPVTQLLCRNEPNLVDQVRELRCAQVIPVIKEIIQDAVPLSTDFARTS